MLINEVQATIIKLNPPPTQRGDGSMFYENSNLVFQNADGEGFIENKQRFTLNANGGAIANTPTNFFGANSNPTLIPNASYLLKISAWMLKTTNGQVTWTFTNQANMASMSTTYLRGANAGLVAAGTAPIRGGSQILNTASVAYASGVNLSNNTTNHYEFEIFIQNGTGTFLRLQIQAAAGSVTPLAGSFWQLSRVPANNIGIFSA